MITFSRNVDICSREGMTRFLKSHFRYNTMNSWNNATSYAHNMKIHHLDLENGIVDKLFDLIETDEFYDPINDLIREFGEAHNYQWQAGFNGRSGGYLVLYQGEQKPSGYKSYCKGCGQRNCKSVTENGSVCGRCGQQSRMDFSQIHMSINTFPGRSTDQHEDFEEWGMDSLQRRVNLVCEFDALCDAIVAESLYMAKNSTIKDETIYVPQNRKVLVTNH